MKLCFSSCLCRRWMSRGVRLLLSESSQEFVSNDLVFGKCSRLCININPCWACAIYVWSYVMSVGRDRKIDIYSVSTKEKKKDISSIFFVSCIPGIPVQLFLQFLNPFNISHPICICLHCHYQLNSILKQQKNTDSLCHVLYNLIWISL